MKVKDLKHDSFYLYYRDNKYQITRYSFLQNRSIFGPGALAATPYSFANLKDKSTFYLYDKQIEENIYPISKLYELLYL
jgi:hypothetical protein